MISMSFDLYGCIQADVRSMELDEKGMVRGGVWMDVSRLEPITSTPLMDVPDFEWGEVAEGRKGPANLPAKI